MLQSSVLGGLTCHAAGTQHDPVNAAADMKAKKVRKNLAQAGQRCQEVMQQTAGLTDMPVALFGGVVTGTGYLSSV